jgi:hypothetical protein
MTAKKINLFADILFSLLVSSSLLYLVFLFLALQKITPGFFMNLIFLFDSLHYLNFGYQFSSLVSSPQFLVNLASGPILAYLLIRFFLAAKNFIQNIQSTTQFFTRLNPTPSSSYFLISSPVPQAFTAGLFHPQVYLSRQLLSTHTPFEIDSILRHEQFHQHSRHPLKSSLIRFILSLLPPLPFLSLLHDYYLTLTEVASDRYSQQLSPHPRHLLTSLIKLQSAPLPSFALSHFSSQSARIQILVGQKSLPYRQSLFVYSLLVFFLLSATITLSKSTVFFDCRHLFTCFQILLTPNQPFSSFSSIPTHCL